ncbi:mannosyltransferase [Tilletia horrida]|uniref:Chitobiosyldiphosphodolichol beta-mannosyltransferase n=1 Tax=Tilletia horrida TaxID=155126 RepID=A0AAN6GGM7_9BASI|nr:mannosyltransferase [Tilletia horrida]
MFIPALLALCCLGALSLLPLSLFVWVALHRARTTTGPHSLKRSAAVVVLGDVGRSPRMCYHAESLANEGYKVGLVGYAGTTLPPPLLRPSVRPHALVEPPRWFAKLPKAAFIVVAPLKILIQSTSLFWALAVKVHPPPELILVQTPPALPTLFIVRFVAWLLRARVVIDWHNLGYTILGLRLGASHPLVRLAAWLERVTGRRAFAHLFVTHAMRRHLDAQWGLRGHKAVLHDRPPVHFRRAHTHETHTLFANLGPRLKPALNDFLPAYSLPESTLFTTAASTSSSTVKGSKNTEPALRPDRPALAVSSTSWTADEDFDILLEAARKYEFRAQRLASASSSQQRTAQGGMSASSSTGGLTLEEPSLASSSSSSSCSQANADKGIRRLPKLLIIVTGKGQLRAHYESLIATAEREERWKFVRIRTAWLEVEEYPILLGSADIGISLHSSSSGLDLPMKVVDMLGCGLPVLALNFPCLPELISDGRNGLVFSSAGQLAEQLAEVVHSGLRSSNEDAAGAMGAGEGRNWMVRAMEDDEALAFGWGDEPPEAIVAAATARAASDRLSSLKWGGSGAPAGFSGGLPTHSATSGASTPSAHGAGVGAGVGGARDSLESPQSFSLGGSPVLDAHVGPGARGWSVSGEVLSPTGLAPGRRRSARARKVATWTGNWRRVVRPLLNAREHATNDASLSSSDPAARRLLLPSEQAMVERRKRKLERAKRKGKGLSVHHRKNLFGQQSTRDDEDYLLHNSDDGEDSDHDSDDDDEAEEGDDGDGGAEVLANTAAAAGPGVGSSSHDGLVSRKQRNQSSGLTKQRSAILSAISIPPNPASPSASATASSSRLSPGPSPPTSNGAREAQSPPGGASFISPSSSLSSSFPLSTSTSTTLFPRFSTDSPNHHLHHHYHDGANSEPLSPSSPLSASTVPQGLHAQYSPVDPLRNRRLSSTASASGHLGPVTGTSSSDADKRWRRRRTYSGSSSLYNGVAGHSGSGVGDEGDDRERGLLIGDDEDGRPGVAVEVDVPPEFVTPFDLEEAAAAGDRHFLTSPTRPGGARKSLPLLHSPLSSPSWNAKMVLHPAPPAPQLQPQQQANPQLQSQALSSISTSPHPQHPFPARQLDSNWSPEATPPHLLADPLRRASEGSTGLGSPSVPSRRKGGWKDGEGEVPDIRVSPAIS